MAGELTAAPPVLSTPAEHLFEHADPEAPPTESQILHRTDDELRQVYEIPRTAKEIRDGRRRRVALQFPDSMLGDAPRVVGLLSAELKTLEPMGKEKGGGGNNGAQEGEGGAPAPAKIYILADTSYSACCVDEIAAEHVDADVVVHYGRSCLSPTSRLPVIYVFTKHVLDEEAVSGAFEKEFPERDAKVILMADVTYQDHVSPLFTRLRDRGYRRLLSTAVVHNPLGSVPNRSIVDSEGQEVAVGSVDGGDVDLAEYAIFHISTPPTALLLALSSRVKSFHIHPTPATPGQGTRTPSSFTPSTPAILGRRYAKVLTLSAAGVIGILVNTLSVANYLSSIDSIRKKIAAAGKKSYTVVVGKLNPAKLANFAEIDGWVVVGCWESSLVEDDAGFYRPAVTPFELETALMRDEDRVWGHRWWGGIEGVGVEESRNAQAGSVAEPLEVPTSAEESEEAQDAGGIDDEESEPPQFDLRTGKLISHSRPMIRSRPDDASTRGSTGDQSLALRPKAELATVNGVVSPGAEFLRSQRTWQGLGSDFDGDERSTAIEEGRAGVARGYVVGTDQERR